MDVLDLNRLKQRKTLDEIDKRIISELQEDSRISFTELAKGVNLSETAIRNRINGLLKSGVIKKFTLQLDFDKINKPITAIIGVKVGGEVMHAAASELVNINGIMEIYTVAGEFDLLLKVVCTNIKELEGVVERIRSLEFVNETNTFVALRKVKEGTNILL